jgi:hypothetical protein
MTAAAVAAVERGLEASLDSFRFGPTGQAKSAAVMPAGWPGGHCTSSIR